MAKAVHEMDDGAKQAQTRESGEGVSVDEGAGQSGLIGPFFKMQNAPVARRIYNNSVNRVGGAYINDRGQRRSGLFGTARELEREPEGRTVGEEP